MVPAFCLEVAAVHPWKPASYDLPSFLLPQPENSIMSAQLRDGMLSITIDQSQYTLQ
jgi:hypothetical protein